MTSQWTASAIAADIQASIDKIHSLMNNWHRGVDAETGNHGRYRIHPENYNYVIFVPDIMPEDYEGNVLPGSMIEKE